MFKLRLQDALLQLRRLRYLAELVVRHNDTIVVVVLDVVEETHAVGGRKVFLRSVQNPRVGICRLIGGGNLRNIGFQPDNHRLVRQVQTLHFMRGDAHYQRLNLAHKPMIIGLKANVAEIAATYQAAYPNARILYASEKDFSTANRVRFSNNVKNNDYDCVVCRTTSSARYRSRRSCAAPQAELDTVEENLEVLRQQGKNVSRAMLKAWRTQALLEAKLEKVEHA